MIYVNNMSYVKSYEYFLNRIRSNNFFSQYTRMNLRQMVWINLKKKELAKKRTFTKNTWYDWYEWLINYIPDPIIKSVGGVKDEIMSLFKTKDYSKPESVKTVYGGGKKQSEENIIKSIRNPFKLEKER